MALPTITIRNKKYPKPSIDRLKRSQARKLTGIMKTMDGLEGGFESLDNLDALWELVGIMVPDLPEDVLDDLEMGECQTILDEAGLLGDDGISVGESSASTSS